MPRMTTYLDGTSITAEPLPPVPMERTVGVLGPWQATDRTIERWAAGGMPRLVVGRVDVSDAAAAVWQRRLDLQAHSEGWILYERAPQWLRQMYDTAHHHLASR